MATKDMRNHLLRTMSVFCLKDIYKFGDIICGNFGISSNMDFTPYIECGIFLSLGPSIRSIRKAKLSAMRFDKTL